MKGAFYEKGKGLLYLANPISCEESIIDRGCQLKTLEESIIARGVSSSKFGSPLLKRGHQLQNLKVHY